MSLAALMAYVQRSLWNVPAEFVVGNTLSLEVREVWWAPALHLGFWTAKLAAEARLTPKASEEPATVAAHSAETPISGEATKPPLSQSTQLSFDR